MGTMQTTTIETVTTTKGTMATTQTMVSIWTTAMISHNGHDLNNGGTSDDNDD